ncbi:MAG: hypothetical protein PVI42_17135 [Desulfobacterales bacterium]|jgi:hypothetical protein
MKKLLVFGLATLLVIAFCVPASALENVFGGFWRVRGYKMKYFSGTKDDNDLDATQTTTRTRLYYTAILNDNLSFVNKFEMDAVFGEQGGYGDFGADGVDVEVKNSYADFNTGPLEWKLGVFGSVVGRSLVFDNDHAGAEVVYRGGNDRWWLRGRWFKAYEAGQGETNKKDYDGAGLETSFKIGEAGDIRPYFIYSWSRRFQGGGNITGVSDTFWGDLGEANNAGIYWAGFDTDWTLGSVALYGSFAYSGGEIKGDGDVDDSDLKGYVVLLGADIPLGPATIHTKGFYASGDAAEVEPGSDINGYVGFSDSFYWSEIMGFGTLDDVAVSAGSPGDKLNNIWAINLGATIKPFDKMSIRGDLWYAAKPQDDPVTGEDKLGVEGNLYINYELVENLNLQLIGAYLWADDATARDDNGNDDDPYEIGFQTSLSF